MSDFKDVTGTPCQTGDPERFFPDPTEFDKIQTAKELCNSCHATKECLTFALTNNMGYGVWGGLTEKERHSMKRRTYRSSARGLK